MNKSEEKLYYQWLEDIIRSKTTSQSFLDHKPKEEHDAEIMFLVNYVQQNNPKLFKKLLAKTINATELPNTTSNDIYKFLGKTKKGVSVIWKDKTGNEFVFVNAGEGSTENKKRIVILGDMATISNIEKLKKNIMTEILRKDIEHVYKHIQKKEHKRHKINSKYFLTNLLSSKMENTNHNTGSFEKNFKEMIRFQGCAASPMTTAQIMINTMNGFDKKNLQRTFSAMNIKNGADLQNILAKWKTEALTDNQVFVKKFNKIRNKSSQIHSIRM